MNRGGNDVILIRIHGSSPLMALERPPEKTVPHRQVILVSKVLEDNEVFEMLKCVFRCASSKNDLWLRHPRTDWSLTKPVRGFEIFVPEF